MFNNILVAVDGSAHSLNAVALASAIAERFEARIVLLHVLGRGSSSAAERPEAAKEHLIEPVQTTAPSIADVPEKLGLSQKHSEKTRIREVGHASGTELLRYAEEVARARGAEQIILKLSKGNAARTILEQADLYNADLIVMGARGLSDLKGLLIGSVSHRVSHLAKCACLTVK